MRRPTSARESERWFAATFACVLVFWLFDLLVLRAGTPDPLDDTWEYGVVARALMEGRGFRTLVIHPPLWSLRDAAFHVPVLVHGPLLPLALLPGVALAGAHALDGAAYLAAIFAVLAALATFRLGERLHSPAVGAAAAMLYTLSPLGIVAVHHDIALHAGAWLLALAMSLLAEERPRGAAAGIALGLGALVRPEFALAFPVLLVLAGGVRAAFALAFALCVAPWSLHALLAVGTPFFNLSSYLLIGYWEGRRGIAVMRDFSLPPSAWPATLAAEMPHLPRKWIEFLPHALKRWLCAPSGATGWLAPVGWVLALAPVRVRPFALASVALGLLPLAVMVLTVFDPRYLVPFLPLAAVGVAIGARELTEWAPGWMRRPRAWIGLLLLAMLPSTLPQLHDGWRGAAELRTRLARERAGLAERFGGAGARATGVVYSDTPDFVAWTLRRPAVWLTEPEYRELPAWDGLPPAPADRRDRPARTDTDATWFHEADGRGALLPAVADARPAAPADTVAAGDSLGTGP